MVLKNFVLVKKQYEKRKMRNVCNNYNPFVLYVDMCFNLELTQFLFSIYVK